MFDRYVAQTKPSWARRALIIASIVVHAGAFIGIGIYSVIHVEEIAPPAISLTFFAAPPPPPPPPPPARKKVEHKVTPTQVVQPTVISKLTQPKEQPKEEEDDGEEGGVEGGVKGGVKGGVVGGTVGGVVGGTGKDPMADAKLMPMFLMQGKAIAKPDPHLPEFFKQQHAGQKFQAKYKLFVDLSGKVVRVDVLTAIGGVDEAIIQQIKQGWAFQPQPSPFAVIWIFNFAIN